MHRDGLPIRYVGICLDVDEQKSTQAALRKAEELCEIAINAAQLPMWEYEIASDTVRGNVHWDRAVGNEWSTEQGERRREKWLSDIHPEDAARRERILEDFSTDAIGFYESEFRIKIPSGEYKWMLDRARVVERTAAGKPLKVVGVSIDIDARKRMESAIKESEKISPLRCGVLNRRTGRRISSPIRRR